MSVVVNRASEGVISVAARKRPSIRAHIQIARPDHWIKNIFVLPGIIVAFSLSPQPADASLALRLFLGLLAVCLVSSSNYVINEVLDAPFDRMHPTKSLRPVPQGLVSLLTPLERWLERSSLNVYSAHYMAVFRKGGV